MHRAMTRFTVGMLADLVIIDGNPAADISGIRKGHGWLVVAA
jgi:imidazolonepropionase-like amidohydrolase